MAVFILTSGGTFYQLDATTEVKYTSSSTVTSNPLEDGSQVSDHVTQNPDAITFTGILTRVKVRGEKSRYVKDPAEFIAGLQALKRDSETVTITTLQAQGGLFGDTVNIIQPLPNCVITDLTFSRGTGSKSGEVMVDIAAKQIVFAERAKLTQQDIAEAGFLNDASEQEAAFGATGEVPDQTLLDISAKLDATGLISQIQGALL